MPARIDYEYIAAHVPEGAKVLDLGCGDGTLLEFLIQRKHVDGRGVDIDEAAVRQCVSKGIPVYHGDMLEGMAMFADGTFDCTILSQTLQQTLQPERVLEQMLRVSRKAIVSFPNWGHWRVRLQLLLKGRVPVTPWLPYQWYETPNVRQLTIKDFLRFSADRNLHIADCTYFLPSYKRIPALGANLLASTAVFVIERHPGHGITRGSARRV